MLRAERLTRRFGARVAVEDVSFEAVAGEVFALLGPNGAGKTTTLRLLAGLIGATSGRVYVADEPMSAASSSRLRQAIGFLTEAPGLWDALTVRQNLTTYARLYELPDATRAVDAVLERFDIADRAGDTTAQLSKGLKQRVAIARSLLHDPRIVLLDEPTSGLDPESAREVRTLIVQLRSRGCAVLLCTHNLDEVERVADRVAVLDTRLVAAGRPSELRSALYAPRVRVVLASAAEGFVPHLHRAGLMDVAVDGAALSIGLNGPRPSVPDLVRLLVSAGADVESVVREERRLEDVYLELLRRRETGGPAEAAERS